MPLPIDELLIRSVASMSRQQREDTYLHLACDATNRGDHEEADQWMDHAEAVTSWQQLRYLATISRRTT